MNSLVKVIWVSNNLSSNGKAKVRIQDLHSASKSFGLCDDTNIKKGEVWQVNGLTDYGWYILRFKKYDSEEEMKNIKHKPLVFKYHKTCKYKEVIGRRDVIISFTKKEREFYYNCTTSKALPLGGAYKQLKYPDPESEVLVFEFEDN